MLRLVTGHMYKNALKLALYVFIIFLFFAFVSVELRLWLIIVIVRPENIFWIEISEWNGDHTVEF